MTTRPNLAALIARVQSELPPAAVVALSPEQIQTALDRTREDAYRLPLTGVYTTTSSGTIQYLDYYAQAPGGLPLGDWEGGVVIQSGTWADVTADATLDLLTGHASFATDHRPPLYWTGHTFDFWATVGDLLRTYIRVIMGQPGQLVDFSEDGQSVKRSQVLPLLHTLAAEAYAQRRRVNKRIVRNDTRGFRR